MRIDNAKPPGFLSSVKRLVKLRFGRAVVVEGHSGHLQLPVIGSGTRAKKRRQSGKDEGLQKLHAFARAATYSVAISRVRCAKDAA